MQAVSLAGTTLCVVELVMVCAYLASPHGIYGGYIKRLCLSISILILVNADIISFVMISIDSFHHIILLYTQTYTPIYEYM